MRRHWRSHLLLLCSLLSTSVVQAHDEIKLYLKWQHSFQFAGYYAALAQGYYEEAELEVSLIPRQPQDDPIASVLSETGRYGISDAGLVQAYIEGQPVVLVAAIFQHSPLVLITRKEDVFQHPSDLVGRTVMANGGFNSSIIRAMFIEAGTDPDTLKLVSHGYSSDALMEGSVDAITAYLTDEPYFYQRAGLPITIFNPRNYGIDLYGDMLFTSQAEINNYPGRVKALREASLKGWRYALSHPEEIIELIQTQYAPELTHNHLQYQAIQTARMIQTELITLGTLDKGRLERAASILQESLHKGKSDETPRDLQGLIYQDYIDQPLDIRHWLYATLGIIAVVLTIIVMQFLLNRRLQRMVNQQTHDIAETRDALQRQMDIIDQFVITSSTDLSGRITHASAAFCQISGYRLEELIGHSHNIVRHPDFPASVYRDMWRQLKRGESWSGELKNLSRSGQTYWVYAHIEPICDQNQNVTGYTAIRQDITGQKQIEELSIRDALTGLYNRRKLNESLAQQVQFNHEETTPFCVILCDIDHFKQVNDQWGHHIGDQVLQQFAELTQSQLRQHDILGRWGGEEFMWILPATTLDQATAIAERLRHTIAHTPFGELEHCTASFGVATYRDPEEEQALMQRVDTALYNAKANGRNRVEVAS